MKIEGIVFDLDATLVNLGGFVDWKQAHEMTKREYIFCGCPGKMVNEHSHMGLFTMLNLVRDENTLAMDENEVEKIQERAFNVVEAYELKGIDRCSMMPGCISTLKWIHAEGIVMGIATSNSQKVAERILESRGIIQYFNTIVGRRPNLRMKPYPDQILKCLKELQIDSSRGIMVGDSVKDVLAAKAANLQIVSIPSHFTNRQAILEKGADKIIENLEELPALILKMSDA